MRKAKYRQEYKIIGILVSVEPKKICINLTLPYSDLNDENKSIVDKLKRLDERMMKELSDMDCEEDVEKIKIYKPIYYKQFHVAKDASDRMTKDAFVKLNISKRFHIPPNLLGSIVEIKAKPQVYNFDNPQHKNQKIRGWNLNITSIKEYRKLK